MSFLKSKHSGWTWDLKRTPFTGGGGSGGGSPAPTQTTAYNTNVPEYARPYVENMLQSTQAQIYNDDMTGFRPYQPYSSDVNNYFAGFSPLQQSAQQSAYYMQTPGQYDLASGLAGASGIQALGAQDQSGFLGNEALGYGATGQMYGGIGAQQALQRAQQTGRQAGMYGGMGAGYGAQAAGLAPQAQMFGQESADIGMGGLGYGALGAGFGGRGAMAAEQGFGAGEQFARQATDPNATAAYMSPYMQNVVDYQKSQALRDFNIGSQLRKAQAVGQGAFGGSRQAIVESEAERSLGSQLQGIAATGSQKAFEDAQRQQQFGANLGLQGLQAGYGGLGLGMQGAQTGLQGLGTALQGQQGRMQGLGQAGQFLGQGIQGAQAGLQGVGAQQAAGQLGLAGTAQGMQGAQTGLQGVQGAIGAGQYGLAGLGQATQSAGTLGQLGTQQFGTEKDIINLQSTMGAQQQALEQSKINQAIQDYAIAQQYPMMQLGFMSNMLRGLPMQAQTTQLYQAQPSALQQGIGLAGAGASLFGGKAEGGVIKMAEGGIPGYKYGGAIPEPKLESMADSLSVAQLQERIKDPALTPGERQVFQEALAAKQQVAARSSGIAAAGGGLFNTMGYAGGGILAFADEGLVDAGIDPETGEPYKSVDPVSRFSEFTNPFSGKGSFGSIARKGQSIEDYYKQVSKAPPATEADRKAQAQMEVQDIEGSKSKDPTVRTAAAPNVDNKPSKASSSAGSDASGLSSILAGLRKEGPQGELGADYLKRLQDLESGADKRLSRADKIAMAKGFLKFGSTAAPGGIGQAAVAGLGEYTEGYGKALESDEKFRMENAKLQSDIQNLRRAEERGDVKLAAELQEKIADRANRLQTANISAAASGRAGAREDAYVKQLMEQGMSLEQALQAVKGAGKAESNDINRAKAALAQINEQLMLMKKDDPARAALIARRDQITQSLTSGGSMQTAGGGAPTYRFDASGNLVKG
jgi:hypothetical protein